MTEEICLLNISITLFITLKIGWNNGFYLKMASRELTLNLFIFIFVDIYRRLSTTITETWLGQETYEMRKYTKLDIL